MKALKIAILALSLFAAPAFATTVQVNNPGDHWSLSYNGILDVNGTPTVMPGLSARVDYVVTGIYYDSATNLTQLAMDITIHNTSNSSLWGTGSVGGVAFDTNPNVVRIGSGASGALGYVALNQTLPTGAGFKVEVCVSGRRNVCDSVNPYGVKANTSATASVWLSFRGNISGVPIDLSNFAIRWADLSSTTLGIPASRGAGIGLPVTPPIPEPASAAVFGIGALLVAAAIRRKRAD